jgi:hypothetical protein
MAFLSTARSGLITDFVEHTVDLIDRIDVVGSDWEPLEADGEDRRLWCNSWHDRCNGISTGTLVMALGDVFQVGGTHFEEYQPVDLQGKFCRITWVDDGVTSVRIGYIVGAAQDRSAVEENVDPDQNKLKGRVQEFDVVGLEYFLGRVQVDTAVLYDAGADLRIGRALIFNGDRSLYDNDTSRRGNRSSLPQLDEDGDPEGDEAAEDFAFTDGATPGVPWSAKDMVRHLLRYHRPVDTEDEPAPCRFSLQFRRDGQGEEIPNDQEALEGMFPTIPTERKTTLDVLNEIIDPKRGVEWWAELAKNGFGVPITTPGFIEVRIRVASRTSAELTLPSGGALPANADQVEMNFDQNVDVGDVVLREDKRRHYDQVIVRGARQTSTFTVSTEDGNLEGDWSTDLENEYKSGGSGATADLKDVYRRNEKFGTVYSHFRIPFDWDGSVRNGVGTGTLSPAIVEIEPDGTVVGAAEFSIWGIRLLNTTRLLVGYNYAASASSPTAIEEIPSGSTPDMMKPFAFFVYTPSGGGDVVARYADKLSDQLGPVGDLTSSYHLAIQQNNPGIIVRGTAGKQHKMAGDSWTGTGTDVTDATPELDFASGGDYDVILGATVTAEFDRFAEGKWPETLAHVPEGKPVEVLTIYAGDKYRLDYLANETTLFIDDSTGTSVPALATGGVIRNDQQALQDIARMRYEWYKVDRQPISITLKHCKELFRLGMLLTTIGEGSTLVSVNSVVNSIQYDLLNGRTTVGTDEADLDIA